MGDLGERANSRILAFGSTMTSLVDCALKIDEPPESRDDVGHVMLLLQICSGAIEVPSFPCGFTTVWQPRARAGRNWRAAYLDPFFPFGFEFPFVE
jgi:hypothetical protein